VISLRLALMGRCPAEQQGRCAHALIFSGVFSLEAKASFLANSLKPFKKHRKDPLQQLPISRRKGNSVA